MEALVSMAGPMAGPGMADPAGTGRRGRGFTLIEAICAMAILVVLATAAALGGHGQLVQIGDSFDEMVALRQASGRLANVAASCSQLAAGDSTFVIDQKVLPGARGFQAVRPAETSVGLFEVVVRVEYGRGRRVELGTLMIREEEQ